MQVRIDVVEAELVEGVDARSRVALKLRSLAPGGQVLQQEVGGGTETVVVRVDIEQPAVPGDGEEQNMHQSHH